MPKISIDEQLRLAKQELIIVRETLREQQVVFQNDCSQLWQVVEQRAVHIRELTSHNNVQSERLTKLDAIYQRTIRLAERFALEKDQLAAANVKLVNMLDEVRTGYNKLAASIAPAK